MVIPERMLAGAIDVALVTLLGALLTLPAYVLGYEDSITPDVVIIGLAVIAYFVGAEWRWGATPGKLLLGLRVRQADGRRPGLARVVVRNALRPLDFLPPFYFGGLLVASLSQRAQRVGDFVARTVVQRRDPFPEPLVRQQRLGMVAFMSFMVLLLTSVVVSVVLGWIAEAEGATATFLIIFTSLSAIVVLAGNDNVRYGALAVGICAVSLIGGMVAWDSREALALDHRDEIRSWVAHEIPLGTSEAQVLAELATTDAYVYGPRVADEDDAQPHGLLWDQAPALGQRFVVAAFSDAFDPGWVCSEAVLRLVFILEEGRVSEVRYVDSLEGCL